jgi:hypothetical protein
MTLELDGQATGCNPVEVGSIPTGVSLQSSGVCPGQRRAMPCPHARRLATCVPRMGSNQGRHRARLAQR